MREGKQFPYTRRVGAYLFFALCSFGIGMLTYALARKIGFNDNVTHLAASAALFTSFLTLRDMTATHTQETTTPEDAV